MKANPVIQYLSCNARNLYLPFKIRIRQWGELPAKRKSALLITNHQHVDEGEIVFTRTYLKHPQIPMLAVNSRRTFETGFFAARLPWTAPFTRKLNPSALWYSLGLLPIENHLHSRALISLAEEIKQKHGDLPLDAFLPGDLIEQLDLSGHTLGELWTPALFERAQTPVKLSALKQPYRREALENFRATMTADIAAAVERVREGATFYYTPEGDFSHDGRMRPLRTGITDAMLPVADPYLCAIAYDPFRGSRLSMLYRVLPPAKLDDLASSLAAARPVTTSALLATYLCTVDGPFAADTAKRAVRKQLDTLPAGVFPDPELERDPDAVVTEALTVLVRMGMLRAAGKDYVLTGSVADARFPHVADMIAFQKNMIEETLAAAARLA
jgi:hypothetical protein